MRNPAEYDVIKLLVDLPEEGLRRGSIGTILMVLAKDSAYECEFCDETGKPISHSATVTLVRPQFEVAQNFSAD